MVTEFAEIEIKPGTAQLFIAAVEKAKPLFLRAAGCHGVALHQSIEKPDHFTLLVQWESPEHHTEMFMPSADWREWRSLVGDYFAAKPNMWHTNTVIA